jgi:hypothetical protein
MIVRHRARQVAKAAVWSLSVLVFICTLAAETLAGLTTIYSQQRRLAIEVVRKPHSPAAQV